MDFANQFEKSLLQTLRIQESFFSVYQNWLPQKFSQNVNVPIDTEHKLNVLRAFSLRPVSTAVMLNVISGIFLKQSIQKRTKWILQKTAFKTFEGIWSESF